MRGRGEDSYCWSVYCIERRLICANREVMRGAAEEGPYGDDASPSLPAAANARCRSARSEGRSPSEGSRSAPDTRAGRTEGIDNGREHAGGVAFARLKAALRRSRVAGEHADRRPVANAVQA